MSRKQRKVFIRIIIASVLVVALMLADAAFPTFFSTNRILNCLLYLIPYFIVGYDVLKKAVKGIINGQVMDENFLMAVATVGAIVIGLLRSGEFVESVAVMLFYQIGELFQSYAVGKSRKSISALMDIRPDYANVETSENEGELTLEQVDPDEVEIGTIIVVQPGEKIPIDGEVIEGESTLNTVALTGESLPRMVCVGDEVFSGCVNMTGVLRIRTTKEFGESTASKILDLVENASSRKSKSEAFISKFARIYTPAVCYGALALAAVPPLVRAFVMGVSPEVSEWIYRALTFLVISCPCALVISIPLTFFGGLGGASKLGILIKGSNYMEVLAKTKCVVFDKTGTLTQGVFKVSEILPANSFSEQSVLEFAALAESASSHPIGKSICEAYGLKIDRSRVSEIVEVAGKGVTANVDGKQVAIGGRKLMSDVDIDELGADVEGDANVEACAVVYVAIENKCAGCIRIADVVKEGAREAIGELKNLGTRQIMLTGDNSSVAQSVAAELGINEVFSELLPSEKVEKVEMILSEMAQDAKSKNDTLTFVGDGINDAPVLARADVGIAMGAMGSDAAIEAADVVLMDDDPRKVSQSIKLSRKCLSIVYQNIVFAIGVKLICLLLGALGIANMWLAIFADVGVMVIAVLNAMRALFVRVNEKAS